MSIWEALLYGAVQGLTEYLPVSSSAHLILLPRFLGTRDPGLTFDVFVHVGTLASTLFFFRKEWKEVFSVLWLRSRATPEAKRLLLFVVVGTIPTLIAGALLHRWVSTVLRGNAVLATTLALGGVALIAADKWAERRAKRREVRQTTLQGDDKPTPLDLRRAVGVGLFQCLALVPGMSRSGSTIMGGRLLGLDRIAATRFSFLLSAPITAAALVFELKDWSKVTEASGVGILPLLIAMLSAFIFGWLAIGGLIKWVNRGGLLPLAIYRVMLAGVILTYLGV